MTRPGISNFLLCLTVLTLVAAGAVFAQDIHTDHILAEEALRDEVRQLDPTAVLPTPQMTPPPRSPSATYSETLRELRDEMEQMRSTLDAIPSNRTKLGLDEPPEHLLIGEPPPRYDSTPQMEWVAQQQGLRIEDDGRTVLFGLDITDRSYFETLRDQEGVGATIGSVVGYPAKKAPKRTWFTILVGVAAGAYALYEEYNDDGGSKNEGGKGVVIKDSRVRLDNQTLPTSLKVERSDVEFNAVFKPTR